MDEDVLKIPGQVEEVNVPLLTYLYETDDDIVVFFYESTDRDADEIIEVLEKIDNVLDKDNIRITEKRTREIYESNKFKGDPNYIVSITFPSFILLAVFIIVCMCCTRFDNPYCKYCAKATQEEMNLNLVQD